MKLRLLAVLGILVIILVSGCTQSTPSAPTCNPPYIVHGTGCCLDQNSNAICDSDEQSQQTGTQEFPCVPSWQCSDWSECSDSGMQTRACTDLNSCGSIANKPEESQSCETYNEYDVVLSSIQSFGDYKRELTFEKLRTKIEGDIVKIQAKIKVKNLGANDYEAPFDSESFLFDRLGGKSYSINSNYFNEPVWDNSVIIGSDIREGWISFNPVPANATQLSFTFSDGQRHNAWLKWKYDIELQGDNINIESYNESYCKNIDNFGIGGISTSARSITFTIYNSENVDLIFKIVVLYATQTYLPDEEFFVEKEDSNTFTIEVPSPSLVELKLSPKECYKQINIFEMT